MHGRSGIEPERKGSESMKQSPTTAIEQQRRKGVRITVTLFGGIAFAIFVLSLLQGLKYS